MRRLRAYDRKYVQIICYNATVTDYIPTRNIRPEGKKNHVLELL